MNKESNTMSASQRARLAQEERLKIWSVNKDVSLEKLKYIEEKYRLRFEDLSIKDYLDIIINYWIRNRNI